MRRSVTRWMIVCAALLPPLLAGAEPGTLGLLEGLETSDAGDALVVTLRFRSPVAYLSHTPDEQGDLVRIRFRVLGREAEVPEQSLQPGRDDPSGVRSLEIETDAAGQALLTLGFRGVRHFRVESGQDSRQILLRIQKDAASDAVEARAAEMLSEGRRAMTAGDLEKAVLVFTAMLELPENSHSADALELLGLARERKGQLAHAVAEYQSYLRRYPDSEGAARVEQRLAVLSMPKVEPQATLRARPEDGPRMELENFGTLYTGYRRESLFVSGEEVPVDDAFYSDLHMDTRLRRGSLNLRSRVYASMRYALDESDFQPRIFTAFLEARDDTVPVSGIIGRSTASAAGVIGRYDGVALRYAPDDRWEVGAVAGFPANPANFNDLGSNRYLAGLNAGFRPFAEDLELKLFGIVQQAGSQTDRAAIGGEMRWIWDPFMVSGFLDYDVYFNSLNVAQLFSSWSLNDGETIVTGLFDHRNVPILTSRNAEFGVPGGGLGGLGDGEIQKLAEDQTGRATNFTLSAYHHLTQRLEISGDFTVSDYTGTDGTADLPGSPGTGVQFAYAARLVANEMLMIHDVNVVSLRFFDGDNFDEVAATFDARFPVLPPLLLNPRLWLGYRYGGGVPETTQLRGSLRADVPWWKLRFEAEVGGELIRTVSGIGQDATGYFVMVGTRYDF